MSNTHFILDGIFDIMVRRLGRTLSHADTKLSRTATYTTDSIALRRRWIMHHGAP